MFLILTDPQKDVSPQHELAGICKLYSELTLIYDNGGNIHSKLHHI